MTAHMKDVLKVSFSKISLVFARNDKIKDSGLPTRHMKGI